MEAPHSIPHCIASSSKVLHLSLSLSNQAPPQGLWEKATDMATSLSLSLSPSHPLSLSLRVHIGKWAKNKCKGFGKKQETWQPGSLVWSTLDHLMNLYLILLDTKWWTFGRLLQVSTFLPTYDYCCPSGAWIINSCIGFPYFPPLAPIHQHPPSLLQPQNIWPWALLILFPSRLFNCINHIFSVFSLHLSHHFVPNVKFSFFLIIFVVCFLPQILSYYCVISRDKIEYDGNDFKFHSQHFICSNFSILLLLP